MRSAYSVRPRAPMRTAKAAWGGCSNPQPPRNIRATATLTRALARIPGILGEVPAMQKGPFCGGFAAETEDLKANAQAERKKNGSPPLAANLGHETSGKPPNALSLFDD